MCITNGEQKVRGERWFVFLLRYREALNTNGTTPVHAGEDEVSETSGRHNFKCFPRESTLGGKGATTTLLSRGLGRRMSHKRGFDEADQEALAKSAHERKSFRRGGLGFSGDGSGDGGGGGSESGAGDGQHQNIQASAASHYNKRGDSHRTLNSRIDTLQQKNLNNWVKVT